MYKIKQWCLSFSKKKLDEDATMECFAELANFFTDPTKTVYDDIPAKTVYLSGAIYGRPDFEDGSIVDTSSIVKLTREATMFFPDGDEVTVTTASGTEYKIENVGPGGMSPDQFMQFGDWIHAGKIRLMIKRDE